jgi:hypothetical protein
LDNERIKLVPRMSAQKSGGDVGIGVCVGESVFVSVGMGVDVPDESEAD